MNSTLTYYLIFVVIGCKIITFWRNEQIFCKKNYSLAYIFSIFAPLTANFITINLVNKYLCQSIDHLIGHQEAGISRVRVDGMEEMVHLPLINLAHMAISAIV